MRNLILDIILYLLIIALILQGYAIQGLLFLIASILQDIFLQIKNKSNKQ